MTPRKIFSMKNKGSLPNFHLHKTLFKKSYLLFFLAFLSSVYSADQIYVVTSKRRIDVIDSSQDTVTTTIPVGNTAWTQDQIHPTASRDQSKIYVPNSFDDNYTVIQVSDNTVIGTISTGGSNAFSIVIPSSSGNTYFAPDGDGTIHFIDSTSGAAGAVTSSLSVGSSKIRMSSNSTGTRLYVSEATTDTVKVVDPVSQQELHTLTGFSEPNLPVITPDNSKVYIANTGSDQVSIIRTSDESTVHATLDVGSSPSKLYLSPNGEKLYVPGSDHLTIIRTSDDTILATVAIGYGNDGGINLSSPQGAVSSDNTKAYFASGISNKLAVINANNTLEREIDISFTTKNLRTLALTSDDAKIYTTNAFDQVSIINTSTQEVQTLALEGGGTYNAILAVGEYNPSISPPIQLTGIQRKEVFFSGIDLTNVLSWSPPTSNTTPATYRIYRDAALTDFLGEVSALGDLTFEEHAREKKQPYTYYIVSVSSTGTTSSAASLTITP